VLIAFDWRLGAATAAVWLAIVALTRYSSLGAIVAALAAPPLAWWLLGPQDPRFWAVLAMAVVLLARHHTNITKLRRGEERRIGEKRDAGSAP